MNRTHAIIVVDTSPIFGGAQRSLLTTLEGVASADFEVLAVCGCKRLVDELKAVGVPAVPFPFTIWKKSPYGLMNAASDIMQFKGFLNTLELKAPGLTFYANGIQSGLLLALSLPKRVRLIVHHRDVLCPKLALKRVLKRAETTIVLSDFMAESLLERAGQRFAGKLKRVYNGFNFERLKQLSMEKSDMELPNGRLFVTFVADLVPWKRHDLFIDAMVLAIKQRPELYGLIVGGPREQAGERYRQRLSQRIEHADCQESIRLVGPVSNPLPMISRSHVLCVLSDNEPFGRTVIEAAAVGTPIIVRKQGGPVEITKGLPAVIEVGPDAEVIAKGILKAVDLNRYEPSHDWLAEFSVDKHCNEIVEILKV